MYSGFSVAESVDMALQKAGAVALSYGQYEIGTEHLLFGVLSMPNTTACNVLQSFNVTAHKLDKFLAKTSPKKNKTIVDPTIDLANKTKEVFLIANQFSSQIGKKVVTLEHILVSMLSCDDCYAVNILKKNFKVNINNLRSNLLQLIKSEYVTIGTTEVKDEDNYSNGYSQSSSMSNFSDIGFDRGVGQEGVNTELPDVLRDLGTDLTLKARMGKIDQIIGRDEEISRVIEILCRKTKNNPVLIGEPGVGKSAIVDGLARSIVQGNVPDLLKDKIVFSLELGHLLAGTKYRGALEEKLKNLIDVVTNNRNIIVFIDEIHTIMQVGSDKGEINPADMLKPYLARGEFQTIGATTNDEYQKYISSDKALERRFQPVKVDPPSIEDTIKILNALKPGFENFHNVVITDDAIVSACVLSDRYITDRNLPDKAIDLIDEASSRSKIMHSRKPHAVSEKDNRIESLEVAKRNALINENYSLANELRAQIIQLQSEKEALSKDIYSNSFDGSTRITENEIRAIISDWTKIPVNKITEQEKDRLLELENVLHKRVIGQDEAVTAVCKAIRRARVGLKDNKRPIGSFMFLGQTGVGKTELCKALAEAMFDDENSFIRIDMSEYMEKHSISKLIGAPPGYAGFDDGGQLTDAVRRKPYSVVLFDEIEKAHPDVFNLLLQVLDDGRLTDSKGRLVNFKNTIIIFTSNVGVDRLPKNNMHRLTDNALNYDIIKNTLLGSFKEFFKPEFVNRIDVVTIFHPLSIQDLTCIAKIFISNLNKRLKQKGNSLRITENALNYLIERGYDPEYGARPLRRLIEQQVEDRIVEEILNGNIQSGDVVKISFRNGELIFETDK